MKIARAYLILGLLVGLEENGAFAYSFGALPLSDIQYAAQHYNNCDQLSTEALVNLMLTPTWWEVAGADPNQIPSPMTLGRSDNGEMLYPPGQAGALQPYRRAFWHTGIGMWQLDDKFAGHKGINLGIEKFNTRDAAIYQAVTMSDAYCEDQDLYDVFSPYCACASDGRCSITLPTPDTRRCEGTFANLMNGQPVDPYSSTDRYGGGKPRTCSLAGQGATFFCIYVNPGNAQGATWWRISPPPDPPDTRAPLAFPFYVYSLFNSSTGKTHEWRYWMAEDTQFGRDYAANRKYGVGSATHLDWYPNAQGAPPNVRASPYGLCDITTSRGACGANTIWVIATLDGFPWPTLASGQLSFAVSGPVNLGAGGVPTRFSGAVPGSYTATYLGGGPPEAAPSATTITQTLSSGGSITFAFNFSSTGTCTSKAAEGCNPPPPCFALSLSRNNPSGGGVPTSFPPQSAGCATGQYVAGEDIQITAFPASGWNVFGWTGTQNDTSTSVRNSVIMPAASHVVTVNYIQSSSSGTLFNTLTPCRLVDTRNPVDPNGPAIMPHEGRTLVVVGNCGIPASATAVSLNVTVVNPSSSGFLSIYPEIGVPPSTSAINFQQGQVRANNAIVGLNAYGGVTVYCGALGPVDYVIDVNGYFQLQAPTAVTLTQLYPQWTTGEYIGVFWTRNDDSTFAAYRIYRATHPDVTTADMLVTEISNQNQIYYKDSGLAAATYYYKVVTVNQMGDIAYSSEADGRVFALSEVISRIPGVPEPGDTTFPANIAIPDSVAVLPRFDCPHNPEDPSNCLGGYFVVSDAIDAEGHLWKRRRFSVAVASNLLNGRNNLRFIFHQFDIWNATFSALDDSYDVTIPDLGMGFSVQQGGSRFLETQIPPGTNAGIILVSSGGVSNNTAGLVSAVP